MRARLGILVLMLATVVFAGCGGSPTAEPVANGETYVSAVLGTGYEGALSVRNQLALGILGLEGSANEITEEQAAALLPLWQGLRGTTRSGASAVAEVDALLSQIEETLTPAQLEAVAAMQLTQDRLGEWAASQGITLGTDSGAGGGMGAGGGLSDEERATRQAENGGVGAGAGGAGGTSTVLLDEVISYLEGR